MEKLPCVHILARASHGTLYTGVTQTYRDEIGNTARASFEASRIKRLVWLGRHESVESAILREKRIKR